MRRSLGIITGSAALVLLAGPVLLASPAQAAPASFTDGSFMYEVLAGATAELVGAVPTGSTDLVIPSTASDGGTTFDVVSIGNDALIGTGLTSVSIPDSVTTIREFAFFSNFLTSIVVPDSVTHIERSAFACNKITSVTLGSGLVEIGEGAFACNLLASATVPKSVMTIGDGAFADNPLTSMTLEGNAPDITPTQDIGAFGPPEGVTVYYTYGMTGYMDPWGGYHTVALGAPDPVPDPDPDPAPDPALAATGIAASGPLLLGGAAIALGFALLGFSRIRPRAARA